MNALDTTVAYLKDRNLVRDRDYSLLLGSGTKVYIFCDSKDLTVIRDAAEAFNLHYHIYGLLLLR